MPFGEIGRAEFGTYFIGYAATPEVTEQMLRNMFLSNPPGNTDLLDCSEPGDVLQPGARLLNNRPGLPESAEEASPIPLPASDGSLRIGSVEGTL